MSHKPLEITMRNLYRIATETIFWDDVEKIHKTPTNPVFFPYKFKLPITASLINVKNKNDP